MVGFGSSLQAQTPAVLLWVQTTAQRGRSSTQKFCWNSSKADKQDNIKIDEIKTLRQFILIGKVVVTVTDKVVLNSDLTYRTAFCTQTHAVATGTVLFVGKLLILLNVSLENTKAILSATDCLSDPSV
jgi:hypothetical protein